MVDAIPVQSDPTERAAADPGDATTDVRPAKGKSLYDVTKASRERARDAARRRGAGSAADRRQGRARDLGQGRTTDSGRGGRPSGEPVSSNGVSGAGHAEAGLAGLGLAAPGPAAPGPAASGPTVPDLPGPDMAVPDLAGPDVAVHDLAGSGMAGPGMEGSDLASQAAGGLDAQHGRGEAQGYPAPDGSGHVDGAGERYLTEARWAQDTDPALDYSTDQDLDYADDSGLDYADDDGRGYPGDGGWDVAGPGESWDNGLPGAAGHAEDRGRDSGRSDIAGLDQLWDIGRGTSGYGQDQAPDATGHQSRDMGLGDAAGPGALGDTGPGSMRGAAGSAMAPVRDMGPAGTPGTVPAADAAAPRETGPSQAREPGSAPDGGSVRDGASAQDVHPAQDLHPARDSHPAWENGRGRENGRDDGSAWEDSAWDGRPAREAGTAMATGAESARDSGRGLPGDFGPGPFGATGGRETADFLAAPPPSSSILTTAPRQEASRTARPANVGTETIAAELAGWAAGELPGQASARLAAWAAIGGVPAPGYRRTEGSDVGSEGVTTERVR